MSSERRRVILGIVGISAGCATQRWADTHAEVPGRASGGGQAPTATRDRPDFAAATANEVMMREHGLFERLLLVYEEVATRLGGARPLHVAFERDAGFVTAGGVVRAAVRMVRRVAEDGHFATEEKLVFSRLRRDGIEPSLLDALSQQHREARALTDSIAAHLERNAASEGDRELAEMLAAYAALSRAHASREETLAYPASRVTQSEEAYARLSDEIARHSVFTQRSWVETEAELVAMESALGIHDMRRYEPATSKRPREI